MLNKDGTIVSVTDNGTAPGYMNSGFWTNAINNITAKLKGKKVSELDTSNTADVVSSATVSSQAIKTALKNATAEAPTTLEAPKISAADLRTEPVFAADEDAAFMVEGEEGSTTYTKEGEDAYSSDITTWLPVGEDKAVVVAGPSKDDLSVDINDITDESESSTPSITEVTLNAVSVEGEKKINDNIEEN